MDYSDSFLKALDHAMLYEVGGFWNVNHPAVKLGLIDTRNNRRAVGYVNDPDDSGGETKFGVAKSANPSVNIKTLTWDQTKQIYFAKYWLAGKCDKLPGQVAIMHFDACINQGVKRANKYLQESVGATQDGIVGAKTLAAVSTASPSSIISKYAAARRQTYQDIVKNKPKQAKYLAGWLRRVNEVESYSLK